MPRGQRNLPNLHITPHFLSERLDLVVEQSLRQVIAVPWLRLPKIDDAD